jgi:hypothetical protein
LELRKEPCRHSSGIARTAGKQSYPCIASPESTSQKAALRQLEGLLANAKIGGDARKMG